MKLSRSKQVPMILGSSLGAFLLGRSTTWVCTRTQEKSNFSGWTKPHSRSTSMQAIDNVVDKSISILPDGSITPVASVADSNDNDSIRRSFSGSCRNLHVDMKKIDERFLRSDEQVLDSMMKVVDLIESSALLAAPTCHRMNDDRLSREMLNSHSHIHLHTWPGSGVLCLNLFSCQDDSLVLILPKLTEIFHYHAPVASLSRVQWTYKERGNHDMQSIESAGDIAQFLQGWMDYDMKNLVASVSTKFQTIEIYDVINPRFQSLEQFQDSMAQNGSYESMHPELYRPDRIVYLDGIMQSRSFGEAAYHEALVHPAMFTHKSPKRVAIVGGGEGATLREVLKHNTVELVTMIEIDELMVNVSKQHLPEWSDCSMLVGSARSCFDDHRAELFYTDAVEWFIVHFGDQLKINASHRYDVIIMDALDPSSSTDFSDVLYGNDPFISSLSNSLNDDGILVAQLGEDETIDSTGAKHSPKMLARMFIKQLTHHGFQRIQSYTEAHGDFLAPWGYMIAFKCADCSFIRWHSNQAMIDLEVQRRSVATVNGSTDRLFRFFDGATLIGYQYPTRVSEELFCRDLPTPKGCDHGHGLSPERNHASVELLDVRRTTIPNISHVVLSSQDIRRDSYLALDETSYNIMVMPPTANVIEQYKDASYNCSPWKMLNTFLLEYGYTSNTLGEATYFVDSNVLLLLNRSCHVNSEPVIPEKNYDPAVNTANTFFIRNHWIFPPFVAITNRDIVAGDEISSTDIGPCYVYIPN